MRHWRRTGGLLVMLVAVLAMGAGAAPATADHCDTNEGSRILIGDADVPEGLVPVPEGSGPMEPQTLRELAPQAPMSLLAEICAYTRLWVDGEGDTVTGVVYDLKSQVLATVWRQRLIEALQRLEHSSFTVPGAPSAQGLVIPSESAVTGEAAEVATVLLPDGRYLFTIAVQTPDADLESARALALRQREKAIAADTAPEPPVDLAELAGQITGGFVAFTVLWLLAITGLGAARDPLSGRRKGHRGEAVREVPGGVVDVSDRAVNRRRSARVLFGLQVAGVAMVAPGLLPVFWPQGLAFAFLGLALLALTWWLGARQRGAAGTGRAGGPRRLFTGKRPVSVTALFAIATVLFAGALLLAVSAAVQMSADRPVVTSYSAEGHHVVNSATLAWVAVGLAVVLLAGGLAAYRRGRRLAALDARAVLERDRRPFVLYLRSFEDDEVKLRAAIAGRRSLVEEFSPRRFDRFEEVVAERLNQLGPVVALNPPGTRLSPLGAARTTLAAEDWQDTIGHWMRDAVAIVVAAPPQTVTPGLDWELRRIDAEGLWAKTVFLCPAVADWPSRSRWANFHPVLSEVAPWAGPLPVDPAAVLAAMLVPGTGWFLVTADRRTEWTYLEALDVVADRIAPVAGVAPRSVVPSDAATT